MINPILDWATQRSLSREYAFEKELVSSLEHWFLEKPSEWCRDIWSDNKDVHYWVKLLVCSLSDSVAQGNPLYPMINIRNIAKNCTDWVTCELNDPEYEAILNDPSIKDLFQIQEADSGWFWSWMWTDCNLEDGYAIVDQYSKNGPSERYPLTPI